MKNSNKDGDEILSELFFNTKLSLQQGEIKANKAKVIEILDKLYGKYLSKVIFDKWELIIKENMIEDLEDEHAESLALIITNESQRIELEELNIKLNNEITIRKEREKELMEVKSQLEEKNRMLEQLTFMDGLTGIPNRRYFDNTIKEEWFRHMRINSPLSLIMIDIDYFKLYNDTYGHLKGDDCLRSVANALNNTLKRSGEFTARYGGEEFIALIPHVDLNHAIQAAEIMKKSIMELKIPHKTSKVCDQVTISLGVASLIPNRDLEHKRLITEADTALYKAKENGRNQVSG